MFTFSAEHNDVHGQVLVLHHVMAVLPPEVHSHAASLDHVAAHLNLTEMLQSKRGMHCCTCDVWRKTLFELPFL